MFSFARGIVRYALDLSASYSSLLFALNSEEQKQECVSESGPCTLACGSASDVLFTIVHQERLVKHRNDFYSGSKSELLSDTAGN